MNDPAPLDPVSIALKVARALDACGVAYLVGGSFASTFHGEPRSTLDVDFALHLDPASCPALFEALSEDFFVDQDDLREAAHRKSLVNVFHRRWAAELGVTDLVEKALREAGVEPR